METISCASLIQCPFFIMTVGASGSGKSTLIASLLTNGLNYFDQQFSRVIIVAGGDLEQESYQRIKQSFGDKLEMVDGYDHTLLESMSLFPKDQHSLIIFDDVLHDMAKSNFVPQLAIKWRSKRLISTFFLSQLTYSEVPQLRVMTRNSTGCLLLPQIRDLSSVRLMGSQMFGKKHLNSFMEIYQDSLKTNGHLYLSTTTFLPSEKLRLISGLSDNQCPCIYEMPQAGT